MMRVIDNHRAELSSIPEGWTHTRMKAAVRNYQYKKNEDENPTVLSLTKTGLKIKTDLSYGKSTESYIGHQLVYKGQFVFTPRDFDATPILCGVSNYDGCISNLYIVFDISKNLYPKYLEYYFYGLKYGFNYFEKLSFGMRFSFNRKQFEHIPLVYPSYETQKEIADFLDRETTRIDQLIEKKEKLSRLLTEKRKNTISSAVLGLDVPFRRGGGMMRVIDNHRAELSSIPEGWTHTRMKAAVGNYQYKKNEDENPTVLSLTKTGLKIKTDLSYGKSTESYIGHQLVYKGQFVFTPRDFDATPILCGVSNYDGCISNLYIVFDISKNLYPKYLEYYFYGLKYGFNYFEKLSFGMRFSFNRKQFEHIPLVYPSYETQKEIADFLDRETARHAQIIKKTNSSIECLKEFRTSLITEAVTGQLDINAWKKKGGTDKRLDNIEGAMTS